MASNVNDEETFQCSKCVQMLDMASKTLPCLHSFCQSCVEMIREGNGPCPQCNQPVSGDDLRLAPFMVKTLKRRQLESSRWRCEWCFEDGITSSGKIWCQDCEKLLCQNCNRGHKKSQRTHQWEDLSGKSREDAIRFMTTDDCRRHRKSKDAYCDRCNVRLCDACYQEHVTASPQCPPRPLSVREEALKGKKEGGPTLEGQLQDFEIHIRATNDLTRQSIEQLSTDCETECTKLWKEFEMFVKETRMKLGKLCDDMREMASQLEGKWRRSLKEREDLLKRVTIWRHTVRNLLTDGTDDEDVVCGLRLTEAELSARLRQSFAPQEKGRWLVTFPKWCHDSLESLKKEIIAWEAQTSGHLQMECECRLQGSKPLNILSIVAGNEDNRVFVGDAESRSIREFINDSGEMVGQCPLKEGGKEFYPFDMLRLSGDILVVCGRELLEIGTNLGGCEGRIFFLALKKQPPFLEIQKSFDTKENQFYSFCQMNKKIFACEKNFNKIVSFNENGQEMKTIHNSLGLSSLLGVSHYDPVLRVSPTTGNLWGSRITESEIFIWDQKGHFFKNFAIDEKFSDFSSNNFGEFYFVSKQGIFSILPKKVLFKFPKKSEDWPKIFVSSRKLFVSFKNDGKNLLKVFKII